MAGDKGLSLEEIKNETVDLVRSSSDRDPVLLFLVFFSLFNDSGGLL